MTNFATGHAAEQVAAEYLQDKRFKIVCLNWKTRYCEIDIVAQKDNAIYFVEVKSRKNSLQGSGLDYITPRKLKQMTFAAEMWVSENKWKGDYCLAAISIEGNEINFLEEL